MANVTTAISVQIDKEDKEQVTEILQKIGVTMSGLVNMTIKQVIMRGGIPFDVAIPNDDDDIHNYFTDEELKRVAKEVKYIEKHPEKYKSFKNVQELKESLLMDD